MYIYPEFRFIDITSSITSCDGIRSALEENRLTVAIQPGSPGEHSFSALVGPCMVCDLSDGEGPVTRAEVERIAGELLLNKQTGLERTLAMTGYDLPLPPPPSKFLFKTRKDTSDSPGRVFDKDVVDVIVGIMKLDLVGSDNSRMGAGEQDEILKLLEASGIITLLNLDLREIEAGVEGMLIVSPLKITDAKRVPARTLIMQR